MSKYTNTPGTINHNNPLIKKKKNPATPTCFNHVHFDNNNDNRKGLSEYIYLQ